MTGSSQGSRIPIGELIQLLGMSIGLAYFISLIIVDAWTSLFRKPFTMWISGKALILTALTIQVLTYLDYKNISLSDNPNPDEYARLLGNQMVIDSGRMVICVFIGYILPGMARPGSASQWGDIAALVISLFSAITSELYYMWRTNKLAQTSVKVTYGDKSEFFSELDKNLYLKSWFVVSSLVVLVLTVMLILLLVSAILAGKTVRGILNKRMESVIKRSSNTDSSVSGTFGYYLQRSEDDLEKSEDVLEKPEDYLRKFEDEIMRLWVLCRVGKPQDVIARSVLSSSVALLVTFSIVLLLFKGIHVESMKIYHEHDGLDWLRHTTFGLQCTFVLLGWVVILWRYFTSVFYIPKSFLSGRQGRMRGCLGSVVEDIWTRSISELIDMYDLHRWRRSRLHESDKTRSNLLVGYATVLNFHKLLYILLHLQNFMVLFSKCCWFMSRMVLRCNCIQKCVLGMDKLSLYSAETLLDVEFLKYKDALQHMCMPGEHPAGLWLANERAFRQAQEWFENGTKKQWEDLTTFLRDHWPGKSIPSPDLLQLDIVKEYFPTLNENCWKMKAVSLLRIIVAVSSLSQDDSSKGESVKKACQKMWDLMTFVDMEQPISIDVVEIFDYELDQVSMSADNEFKNLIAGKCLCKDKLRSGDETSPNQVIGKLLTDAEEELKEQRLLRQAQEDDQVPLDSIDWNAAAPAYNMYRLCKHILGPQSSHANDSVHEMVKYLCDLLVGVIGECLLNLPDTIVRSFRKWAVDYEEEKIWDAIYIAGQTKVVLKHLLEAKLIKIPRPMPEEVQPQE